MNRLINSHIVFFVILHIFNEKLLVAFNYMEIRLISNAVFNKLHK